MLSGAWYAFRDTVVDLATLFLDWGSIFEGGQAVAGAFTQNGLQALVDLGTSLHEFINATHVAANPYPEGECPANPVCNFNVFKLHWYAGYIAATIGLSLLGAAAAKAIVQGIKATTVFTKISGALSDLSSVAKVTEYVNRLRGIGIVNSRILVAGVFTACAEPRSSPWERAFDGAGARQDRQCISGVGIEETGWERPGEHFAVGWLRRHMLSG